MYLLDSSAIIELLQNTNRASEIIKTIQNNSITSTAISLHEVAIGEDEFALNKIFYFFKTIGTLSFDKDSVLKSLSIERELRKEGKLINRIDIFIAGICQQHNLTLITLDKDFNKIKSIKAIVIN